tara:strand:- start:11 stop:703 length:693 start_codon:yes stop_codon:yes gene_type:complete
MKQQTLTVQTKKRKEIIKSISYDQNEIMQWIIDLYCPNGFEVDPTYSVGNFYKKIPQPKYKYDINPRANGVVESNCTNLSLGNDSVKSIMFDPPFIVGLPAKDSKSTSIIGNRFSRFKDMKELFEFYHRSLLEFHRILKVGGWLIFKCQDSISSGRQYLSHVEIINYAVSIGFYPKDMFILVAKNRIIGKHHHKQQHARKFHSYFLVFKKERNPVNYFRKGHEKGTGGKE